MKESFGLFFDPRDVVGIKVNPVGPPLINTRPEVVEAVIQWLVDNGMPASRTSSSGTASTTCSRTRASRQERFPGIAIEGLQTMDETGNKWKDTDGNHVSINNFDQDVFYFAKGIVGKGVTGLQERRVLPEPARLQRRVLVLRQAADQAADARSSTWRPTRTPAPAISMATKNIGYGVGLQHGPAARAAVLQRLHRGARGARSCATSWCSTSPTACARSTTAAPTRTRSSSTTTTRSTSPPTRSRSTWSATRSSWPSARRWASRSTRIPRFTEYLRYAETLGLGVVSPDKLTVVKV